MQSNNSIDCIWPPLVLKSGWIFTTWILLHVIVLFVCNKKHSLKQMNSSHTPNPWVIYLTIYSTFLQHHLLKHTLYLLMRTSSFKKGVMKELFLILSYLFISGYLIYASADPILSSQSLYPSRLAVALLSFPVVLLSQGYTRYICYSLIYLILSILCGLCTASCSISSRSTLVYFPSFGIVLVSQIKAH